MACWYGYSRPRDGYRQTGACAGEDTGEHSIAKGIRGRACFAKGEYPLTSTLCPIQQWVCCGNTTCSVSLRSAPPQGRRKGPSLLREDARQRVPTRAFTEGKGAHMCFCETNPPGGCFRGVFGGKSVGFRGKRGQDGQPGGLSLPKHRDNRTALDFSVAPFIWAHIIR